MATKKEQEQSADGRQLSLFELESELTEAMEAWLAASDDHDGETAPAEVYADTLEQIVRSYLHAAVAKRDKVADFMLHLRVMADAAHQQAEFYQRKQKTFERSYERLKEYVKFVMESQGVKKLEGERRTFSLRKTADRIEILDEKLIPERHMVDREPVPDKRSIMEEYKMLDKVRKGKLEKEPGAEVPEPSVPGTVRRQDGKTVVIT